MGLPVLGEPYLQKRETSPTASKAWRTVVAVPVWSVRVGMMKKNSLLIPMMLALSVAVALPHATASLTIYTDRTAWENAVGNIFMTENFNSVTPFDLSDGLNDVGLFDIFVVGTANLTFPNSIIDPNITPNSLNIDGTTFLRGASLPASFPTLIFSDPIIGFGADWTSPTSAGMLTLQILGDVVEFDVHAPLGGFLGVVSDTLFTEVAMPAENAFTEGYGMDNVSFAIPAPGALAFIALAGLMGTRRRRR